MFDPILVPLDGSPLAECVLPHASALAQAFQSRLLLLRVLDRNQETDKTQLFDLVNWQFNKAGANVYLDKVSARMKKANLKVETTAVEGGAAETIVDIAQSKQAGLIILSSHGRSGLSRWGISGMAQNIIFSAPNSVLLIRAEMPREDKPVRKLYRRILVPLDGSRRAENVLPVVAMFARHQNSEVHLAHVVQQPEMPRQLPLSPEDQQLADQLVARNKEEAAAYLDRLHVQSPLDGIEVRTHLVTSANAALALHQLTEEQQIDLVALNAHGYSGSNQWPYGSMVNNFILYSKVPLLIVQDLPVKEEPVPSNVVPRHLTEQ